MGYIQSQGHFLNLLGLKMFYRDYLGVVFPSSLLSPSKSRTIVSGYPGGSQFENCPSLPALGSDAEALAVEPKPHILNSYP